MRLLFSEHSIHSVISGRLERAKDAARQVPETRLRAVTDDELVEELVSAYSLAPPKVNWEAAKVSRAEATVDLQFIPNTMASYERRSVMAPGEKYTIEVPFEGSGKLLMVQPSTYTLNPPRATISGQNLVFEYSGTQVNVEQAKAEYEGTKAQIENSVSILASDLAQIKGKLEDEVRPILNDKRARMEKGDAAISGFGLPTR